jgi:hypothetical protein
MGYSIYSSGLAHASQLTTGRKKNFSVVFTHLQPKKRRDLVSPLPNHWVFVIFTKALLQPKYDEM